MAVKVKSSIIEAGFQIHTVFVSKKKKFFCHNVSDILNLKLNNWIQDLFSKSWDLYASLFNIIYQGY